MGLIFKTSGRYLPAVPEPYADVPEQLVELISFSDKALNDQKSLPFFTTVCIPYTSLEWERRRYQSSIFWWLLQ